MTQKALRDNWYLLSCVVILAVALALRTWGLDVKPAHFDEGINGWFVEQMKEAGHYNYNPENFHGPFYFYLLFVAQSLFSHSLFWLRMPAVLGSLASILLIMRYYPLIGKAPALIAAVMMSISPAQIFFARYSIHESWFMAFTIMSLLGIIGLWQTGRAHYLGLLIAGLAGQIATKETSIIHIGCMLLAIPVCWGLSTKILNIPMRVEKQQWSRAQLISYSATAGLLLLLLYTGLFASLSGLVEMFHGYTKWIATGTKELSGHEKPWTYWIYLGGTYEWASLLGVIASAYYAFWGKASIRYLAIYAVGVLAAYTIVAYKTPWCIISIQWPFFILLSVVMVKFYSWNKLSKYAIIITLIIVTIHSSIVAYRINWVGPTNPKEPYVYVQTSDELNEALLPVISAINSQPLLRNMKGHVNLDSYFPIPWLLYNMPNVGYGIRILDNPAEFKFIICKEKDKSAYELFLPGYSSKSFKLRDAQEKCVIFVHPDLRTSADSLETTPQPALDRGP